MNNLTKNLLLWLVIAIVLMSVFNNFGNRQQATRPLEYSTFIQKVKQNEVDRVTIQGRRDHRQAQEQRILHHLILRATPA